MSQLLTTADTAALLSMSPAETNKTVAQMTALMSAMANEKDNLDSMASMLEKQPWYKKMWFTLTGKNKATVKEISQSKDKLASYTSAALAQLYENSRIEQSQIISVGQAVNLVNAQLAKTNYQLIKTQEALAEFQNSIISTIGNLANKLNEKILSMDNYHMLIEEINLNTYDGDNLIATLFSIISQIDKRMAGDDRKMQILRNTMTSKGYLSDVELPLSVYMQNVAALPDEISGTVYYEFFSLNSNMYAEMFCELMESYTMLPKMEKKSKKVDVVIDNILTKHDIDSDTTFSTSDFYDYFIDSKKDYLLTVSDTVAIPEQVDNGAVVADDTAQEKVIDNADVPLSDATPTDTKEVSECAPANVIENNNEELPVTSYNSVLTKNGLLLFSMKAPDNQFNIISNTNSKLLNELLQLRDAIDNKLSVSRVAPFCLYINPIWHVNGINIPEDLLKAPIHFSSNPILYVSIEHGVNITDENFDIFKQFIKKYDTTRSLCVFFACDDSDDDELIEVIEDDIHDCLNKLGYYKKNSVPIYRGSLSQVTKGKDNDCLEKMITYIKSKSK